MDAVWMIFLLAFGACAGSFMNVVIYRLPRGESIVFPGSHCPSCGRGIRWYDNIPLLSWLLLRGRCRWCRARISPRYLIVEGVTAVLFVGLYVCYYVLQVRAQPEAFRTFLHSWPMYAAHITLLCSLLVCSVIDVRHWSVPLEVCWFASVVGVVSSAAAPHPWMPRISPITGAMSLAAGLGLVISLLLERFGLILPSFIDATGKAQDVREDRAADGQGDKPGQQQQPVRRPKGVAISRAHGVRPRREILREIVFLGPAFILAVATYHLLTCVECVGKLWAEITGAASGGPLAVHLNGFLSALHGYLVGGLWVWGIRILGTLAFDKEAMGMGDVHILAAVGAVTGWIVPSIAFFVAPFLGLLWAIHLLLGRKQHEVPYGPWLAAATAAVLLGYDRLTDLLHRHAEGLTMILR
jgi:leader peptidase (prepilin peptidase)/N-methyltransferase